MKLGKAAGPSGNQGSTWYRCHHDPRSCNCDYPWWQGPNWLGESFIVCLYKGKGDALDRGNYRGIKLIEQAMKILERIVYGLIRQVVSIDDS